MGSNPTRTTDVWRSGSAADCRSVGDGFDSRNVRQFLFVVCARSSAEECRITNPEERRFESCRARHFERVAQRSERRTLNALAVGSIPTPFPNYEPVAQAW